MTYPTVQIHVLHPRPLKTESITLMEFYSGQPDILAASVRDYCTGVLTWGCGLMMIRRAP